jgi:DNA-binding Lrp family transcriptional regulator
LDFLLTKLQRKLCNALQDGLPICARPFARIAKDLNCDEKTLLQQTGELKQSGIIRRIRTLIDYGALGKISTLVTAHIPEELFQKVAEAVNSLEGVSHNYRRVHFYNLWFTLQARTEAGIKAVLSGLSARFDIEFHSLPVRHFFKLDVRFDAEDTILGGDSDFCIPKQRAHKAGPVKLNANQKLILSKLQSELDIIAKPFDFLCTESLSQKEVLVIIKELIDKGVIRRIAAVVDYRRLGFVANVMFCCEVPADRIVEAGRRLARFRTVSHCYERQTFEGWPYNLYAMMHGKTMGRIQHVIDRFLEAERINSFELLPTAAELKKQPVKHKFDQMES